MTENPDIPQPFDAETVANIVNRHLDDHTDLPMTLDQALEVALLHREYVDQTIAALRDDIKRRQS
jgi:hypothetical protein